MPKQVVKINRFEGGLINHYDPRDIPENGLVNATDVMVDIVGKVRQMGRDTVHPIGAISGLIEPGYGIFTFNTDQNTEGTSGEYSLLAITRGANIDIYDTELRSSQMNLGGDSSQVKPTFYYMDGMLRVCDGNFDNTNNSPQSYKFFGDKKWFAYPVETASDEDSDVTSAFPNDRWLSTEQKIRAGKTLTGNQSIDGSGNITDIEVGGIGVSFHDAAGGKFSSDGGYKFGYTLLYEPSRGGISEFVQESPLSHNITATLSVGSDNSKFTIKLWVCTGAEGGSYNINSFDPRVVGCRIYWMGDSTGLFEEPAMLAEAYFGSSATDRAYFVSHDGDKDDSITWTTVAGNRCAQFAVTTSNIPSITYALNNTYTHTETTFAKYKTMAMVGDHAYIGNIQRETSPYDPEDDFVFPAQHDVILRSAHKRFDIFPENNYISTGADDGDQIVKLAGLADKLIIFKKKSLYVLNVSGDFDYIEAKFKHQGVSKPYAVTEFEGGVAWVNRKGCFIYNGEQVINLIEGKIIGSTTNSSNNQLTTEGWKEFVQTTAMIGYLPQSKQLLIMQDPANPAASGKVLIFDLTTKSWTRGLSRVGDNTKTNIISTYDDSLLYMDQVSSTQDTVSIENPIYGVVGEDVFWSAKVNWTDPNWTLDPADGGDNQLRIGSVNITNCSYTYNGPDGQFDHFAQYLEHQIHAHSQSDGSPHFTITYNSEEFLIMRRAEDVNGTYSTQVTGLNWSGNGPRHQTNTSPVYTIPYGILQMTQTANSSNDSAAGSGNFPPRFDVRWKMKQGDNDYSSNNHYWQYYINSYDTTGLLPVDGGIVWRPPPLMHFFSQKFTKEAWNNPGIGGATGIDYNPGDWQTFTWGMPGRLEFKADTWAGTDFPNDGGTDHLETTEFPGFNNDNPNVGGGVTATDADPLLIPTDQNNDPLGMFSNYALLLHWGEANQDQTGESSHGTAWQDMAWSSNTRHVTFYGCSAPDAWDLGSTSTQAGSGNLINTTAKGAYLASHNLIVIRTMHGISWFIPGNQMQTCQPGSEISIAGIDSPNSEHNISNIRVSDVEVKSWDFKSRWFTWHPKTTGGQALAHMVNASGTHSLEDISHLYDIIDEDQTQFAISTRAYMVQITAKFEDQIGQSAIDALQALTSLSIHEEYTIQHTSPIIYSSFNEGVEPVPGEYDLHIDRNWSMNDSFSGDGILSTHILDGLGQTHSISTQVTAGQTAMDLAEVKEQLIENARLTDTGYVQPWDDEGIVAFSGVTITILNSTSFKITNGIDASQYSQANRIYPRIKSGDEISIFNPNSGSGNFSEQAGYKVRIASISYNAGSAEETITIATGQDGTMIRNTLPGPASTYAGVTIKSSVIYIKEKQTTWNHLQKLMITSGASGNVVLKEFMNTETAGSSVASVSSLLNVETKDFDFEYPGVFKNLYKVVLTVKGSGSILLEFAVNGESTWHKMTDAKSNLTRLTLDTDNWDSREFTFAGSNELLANIEDGNYLFTTSGDFIDHTLRDVYSVRFRIRTDTIIYNFGLNDLTLYYRVKGLY